MLLRMKLFQVRTLLLTVLIAVALALGGAVAHGQRPQGGGTPGPMLVDFSATTADGKAVTDLTAADLSIKVGGKVRSVTDLTLKKVAAPAAGGPAAEAAPAPAAGGGMTPPFFTNAATAAPAPAAPAAAGRYYLIVVDTESLSPGMEPQIKAAIEGLLKELTPADHVAFSIAPHDTAQIGFGTSLAAVRSAVANLRGQKQSTSNSDDAAAVALCRTSDTLNLLKALMQQAPAGDTPMNVITIAASLSTPGTASSKASTGTTCNVQPDQYSSLPGVTSGARANMYVVQGDPSGGRDSGLDNLAGVTGGGAVMKVIGDGFAPRVLSESSAYWIATLAPDPGDKPNQSQRLELKTTKEGVTIHTRPEVMMSRPGNAAGAAAPAAGKAGTALKDIAAQQAAFTDVQLRAYAFAQRGAGDKMNVLVQAEPVDPSVKLTAMKVGFFDASGKGGVVDAPQVANYPITIGLPVTSGQYRIRVAATDSNNKSGAVDIKLDTTPVPADPFKLGGLMLAVQGEKGVTPKLWFNTTDKVMAMFEMYGIIPPAAEMRVGFEIAPSDTAKATKTFRPTGSQPTAEPDKVLIFGEIPLDGLEPGDYVIRGVVQLKDHPEGKTIRTMHLVKK